MSKFHINKHGVPAPCRATKGNCPLGGSDGTENHFDTQEEAQSAADKMNENTYGFLPTSNDVPVERRVDLYHATSSQILNKIIDDGGLNPPSESGVTSNGYGFDDSAEENGVYLSNDENAISIYLDDPVGNPVDERLPSYGAIIELYADSDNLIADKDDFKGDNFEEADWKDSLEDCNQVVHNGAIQSSQIKSVTFTSPFNAGSYIQSSGLPVSKSAMPVRRSIPMGQKLSLDEAKEVMMKVNAQAREFSSKSN